MKDWLKSPLLWIVLIGVPAWWFYHSHEKASEQKVQLKQKADKRAEELLLGSFAKRHNAVVEWQSSLPKRENSYSAGPFAIDLSRALIRSNCQPVLLMARLRDVTETEGGAVANFSASDLEAHFGILLASLDLKCSPEQVSELTKAGVSRDTEFALAVAVERVSRPRFRATGIPRLEPDDTSIEIDADSSVICLSGTLVGLLRMKGDEP